MMNLMTFPQLTGKHLGAWRSKKSWTKSYMDLDKYIQIAKKAEADKFDVVFVADISGVPMEDKAALEFTAPWPVAGAAANALPDQVPDTEARRVGKVCVARRR